MRGKSSVGVDASAGSLVVFRLSACRTFRPRKTTGLYPQLKQHIDATIGSGNLREAVRVTSRTAVWLVLSAQQYTDVRDYQVLLPPGEDLNEWSVQILEQKPCQRVRTDG